MPSALKPIRDAIATAGGVSFLFAGVLNMFFAATRTEVPRAVGGEIYTLEDHGKILYLSKPEWFAFVAAFVIGLSGFLCAAVLTFVLELRSRRDGGR